MVQSVSYRPSKMFTHVLKKHEEKIFSTFFSTSFQESTLVSKWIVLEEIMAYNSIFQIICINKKFDTFQMLCIKINSTSMFMRILTSRPSILSLCPETLIFSFFQTQKSIRERQSALQFSFQSKHCTFKQNYSRILDQSLIGVKNRGSVILGVVQCNQIPEHSRAEFGNWVFCRNVSVIHFYKAASVNSFWSYQVESLDILQSVSTSLRFRNKNEVDALLSTNVSLDLNPQHVSEYVTGLDSTTNDFRKLLKVSIFTRCFSNLR